VVGMFVNGSGRNEQSLQGVGPSIDSFYYVSVHLDNRFQKRRIKKKQQVRKKNRLLRPCFLMDPEEMSNLDRGPLIYASYQESVHLVKRFQRRRI
jgi:hypothetical protein